MALIYSVKYSLQAQVIHAALMRLWGESEDVYKVESD